MKCIFGNLILVLIAFNLASCQSNDGLEVNHVVICWLKDNSEKTRKDFFEAVESLRSIPGVVSVSYGAKEQSVEPVADNSFDVGFIIKFESKSALDSYLPHPDHVKAVKEVLKPSLRKVVVYDFKSE